jgi:putative SOS response-associated peptidase YedK
MCYAHMIRADLKAWLREFGASLDIATLEDLFSKRIDAPRDVRFPLAMDRFFLQRQNDTELGLRDAIDAYRARRISEWEQEIFKQRKRYADAQRTLQTKPTKKAEADIGIASRKIEQLMGWLGGVKTLENKPDDAVVHAMNYGPIIADTGQGRILTAMRYHCRLAGKPAAIDRQLPGLYNARKSSLREWWAPVFGIKHALIVLTGFRENVKRHDMEHRGLKPEEEPENVVLQFNPRDHRDMLVPCLWDRWEQGGVVLNSFALITDDPPSEVAAAGHNRCPINLTREAAEKWLAPQGRTPAELLDVLEERQTPYYEHMLAVA